MSTFLYYIPHVVTVSADDVKRVGITALDKLESVGWCSVERGPDGNPGCVFACQPDTDAGELPRIGFYPASQAWSPANAGSFWLGYEPARKPRPADLQRAEFIGGHVAELDDGNAWTVPLARAFGSGVSLPQALVLGPNGELIAEALPKFARLGATAERVFTAFLDDGEDLTVAECWDIAVIALAQNYRLSKWEVSALRLLTTDNVQTVLGHLIDLPAIIERAKAQKKSQLDSDSLSVGQAA